MAIKKEYLKLKLNSVALVRERTRKEYHKMKKSYGLQISFENLITLAI